MPRLVEKYYPFILGGCSVFICVICKFTSSDIPKFENMLSSYVNMSSIIIGFLATMISILITSVDKNVMKKIKKFNVMNLLTNYINVAVISGLVVVIYSVGYSTVIDKTEGVYWYMFLIWVFVATLFLAATFRMLQVMLKILTNIANESDKEIENNVMDSRNFDINIEK